MKQKKVYQLCVEECGRTTTTPFRSVLAIYKSLDLDICFDTFWRKIKEGEVWDKGQRITVEKHLL